MLHLVAGLQLVLVAASAVSAAAHGGAAPAPSAAAAAAQRGIALAERGLHAEAVAALEESLELLEPEAHNEASTTLVNLGLVWEQAGLPFKALETYGHALELNPSSAAAYMRMGAALDTHLSERELAREAVQTAVELEPTRADAWNLLGQIHHSSGALDEAQHALAQATSLQPDDATMLANYATTLRAVGRFDESLRELRLAAVAARAAGEDGVHAPLAFAPLRIGEEETQIREETPSADAADAGWAAAAAEEVEAQVEVEARMEAEAMEPKSAEAPLADPGSPLPRPSSGREVLLMSAAALPAATPAACLSRLGRVFVTPVASAAECEWAIAQAEAHAAQRGGWDGRGHHDTHRTNDIVVAECGALCAWLQAKLRSHILPALASQFGIQSTDELWLEDAFLIKYEAHGQRGLGVHADDSELSFTVLLADPKSFEGGGTSFHERLSCVQEAATEEAATEVEAPEVEAPVRPPTTVRPARGEMVSHFGRLFHAGEAVDEGTRYVLAGFVRAKPLAEAWRELRRPPPPPPAGEA